MELKAFEVAKLIDGVVDGDNNSTINRLSKIESGDKNSLSFLGNSKYNDFIAKADAARDAKDWMNAKKFYRDANIVDGSATYPQEQIDWINEQMKKETEDEFKQQYDKLIAAADEQFNAKSYEKSKELFIRAKNMNPDDGYPDQKIAEISAASIIAKVSRDKVIKNLSKKFSGYFWDKNYGYGTKKHILAIKKLGVTEYHRKKFKPIHNILIKK